ncbi:hypothetical protein H5410_017700 [Solanum commersonii]|uniref:Uncharacterized protein n=1 Tax=Solanum commersonii TaxID=4109 RepID=A0A9J6A140_SOLCO|nr:hypothetical protein H5410_017700 [Solanum commersonii]
MKTKVGSLESPHLLYHDSIARRILRNYQGKAEEEDWGFVDTHPGLTEGQVAKAKFHPGDS